MPELVVAPSIVKTSPNVGTKIATKKEINIKITVNTKFYPNPNLCPLFIVSSSMLSLMGSSAKGAANKTIDSTPIKHILMIVFYP